MCNILVTDVSSARRWTGRPTDTVVVLLATGSFEADHSGDSRRSTGRAAFAMTTQAGAAISLGLYPSLTSFMEELPDRTPSATCRTSGDPWAGPTTSGSPTRLDERSVRAGPSVAA